jgi:hypothetical protein
MPQFSKLAAARGGPERRERAAPRSVGLLVLRLRRPHARRRVGLAALELEPLGLEPAADLGRIAQRGRADGAVGLRMRCAPGGSSRRKRWLSVRAWRSVPPQAWATSP